jgi:hypothetical protein
MRPSSSNILFGTIRDQEIGSEIPESPFDGKYILELLMIGQYLHVGEAAATRQDEIEKKPKSRTDFCTQVT